MDTNPKVPQSQNPIPVDASAQPFVPAASQMPEKQDPAPSTVPQPQAPSTVVDQAASQPPAAGAASSTPLPHAELSTPIQPVKPGSSPKLMMVVVGLIAVIGILGFVAYNIINNARTKTAAVNYATNAAHPTPTVPVAQPTENPNSTSDTQLQKDSQGINTDLNTVNTDLSNTDQSLRDQPVDVNQ